MLRDRRPGELGQPFVDCQLVRLRQVGFDREWRERVGAEQWRRELFLRDSREPREQDQLLRAIARQGWHAGRHDDQTPHRTVFDQRHAVAVVDDAAVRLEHDMSNRVGLRQGRQSRAVCDLQLRELQGQHRDDDHRQRGGSDQAQRPSRLGNHAAELNREFSHAGCGPDRTKLCSLRTSSIPIGISSAL